MDHDLTGKVGSPGPPTFRPDPDSLLLQWTTFIDPRPARPADLGWLLTLARALPAAGGKKLDSKPVPGGREAVCPLNRYCAARFRGQRGRSWAEPKAGAPHGAPCSKRSRLRSSRAMISGG